MSFKIDNISHEKENKNYYKLFYDNESISIWTPYMKTPFGFENNYEKYLLKLEFEDMEKNTQMIHLYNVIKTLEKYIIDEFKIDKEDFRSSIRENNGYNKLLTAKFIQRKDRVLTKVKYESDDDYLKTVYELDRNSYVKCQLEIKKAWIYPKSKKRIAGLMIYIKELTVR